MFRERWMITLDASNRIADAPLHVDSRPLGRGAGPPLTAA
jgi:hypothetical protein